MHGSLDLRTCVAHPWDLRWPRPRVKAQPTCAPPAAAGAFIRFRRTTQGCRGPRRMHAAGRARPPRATRRGRARPAIGSGRAEDSPGGQDADMSSHDRAASCARGRPMSVWVLLPLLIALASPPQESPPDLGRDIREVRVQVGEVSVGALCTDGPRRVLLLQGDYPDAASWRPVLERLPSSIGACAYEWGTGVAEDEPE